jgi:hypothetical protein
VALVVVLVLVLVVALVLVLATGSSMVASAEERGTSPQ